MTGGANPDERQSPHSTGQALDSSLGHDFTDQDLTILRIMVDQTNYELGRSWVRNNILITINAGLLALVANSLDKISDVVIVLFGVLGMATSAIWFQIARMGKHYSERLRHDMIDFLIAKPSLCAMFPANARRTPVQRPKGPNASKCMKILAAIVFTMWLLLLLGGVNGWGLRSLPEQDPSSAIQENATETTDKMREPGNLPTQRNRPSADL